MRRKNEDGARQICFCSIADRNEVPTAKSRFSGSAETMVLSPTSTDTELQDGGCQTGSSFDVCSIVDIYQIPKIRLGF